MTDSTIARIRERASNAARATDEAQRFPRLANPPVDEQLVRSAEALLGHPLPPLLADAYRFVGNGGFGPGYGLLPLIDSVSGATESVVSLYTALCSKDPEDPAWAWPTHLVPFCDWGCAIRSCVDCSSPRGAVLTFDPNLHGIGEPASTALAPTHASLQAWFADWLADVSIWNLMFEPDLTRTTTGTNPFTKESFSIVPTKLRRA